MGMARHGVPQIARVEFGQAHAELAGFQYIGNEVFVDGAAVTGEIVTQGDRRDVRRRHFFGRISGMSRGAVVVKLRRLAAINAGEHHFLRAFSDIQRIAVANFKTLAVNRNRAWSADVNHTQLATLQEIAHAQLFAHFAAHGDGFTGWHNAADDDAVDVAVHHGVLISNKHLLN
ncbi:hypothetical protein D3C76_1253160 [compost metagenome]